MLNEKVCKIFITEPNGIRVSVARAINTGDFQASHCCKECTVENCDDDGEGYL